MIIDFNDESDLTVLVEWNALYEEVIVQDGNYEEYIVFDSRLVLVMNYSNLLVFPGYLL